MCDLLKKYSFDEANDVDAPIGKYTKLSKDEKVKDMD